MRMGGIPRPGPRVGRIRRRSPHGRYNARPAAASARKTSRPEQIARTMFKTIGLIGKHGDRRVAATLEQLVTFLRARPLDVLIDAQSAGDLALPDPALTVVTREELGQRSDLVVVVAGDGTFLGAARSLVVHGVPLVGINLGRLGFLADIMPGDMTQGLGAILDGRFQREERILLETRVNRGDQEVAAISALNDVVVHKLDVARLLEFETHIDGRPVNNQRSDGLIVATPTGSTAYALSGGGPILHPDVDAVVIVAICPHTLSSRPLVVSAASRIEIRMRHSDTPAAQLTCDGQDSFELAANDRLTIVRGDRTVRLIHPPGHDYYATLRAKLHWGGEL